MNDAKVTLKVRGVAKGFTLHAQGGVRIPVLAGVQLSVAAGEVVALGGPSGAGKSSLMRMLYGNYGCSEGEILVRHRGAFVDMATAEPRTVLDMRRETIGYISQFLRVIPRVPCLDIVAEPLIQRGVPAETARERAAALLDTLRIPERLWGVSPVTFSGGEQQRVNLARGFVGAYPILLLDEPTASLDADNARRVVELIGQGRDNGAAIVGIFHDRRLREELATRTEDVTQFKQAS